MARAFAIAERHTREQWQVEEMDKRAPFFAKAIVAFDYFSSILSLLIAALA